MSDDNCSKLLVINLSSSDRDEDKIKMKDTTNQSDQKVIVLNELKKYLSDSDFNSTTSLTDVEDIIEEIALKQEGSRFLQNLIIRFPLCSEYIFQNVSHINYNISR